MLKETAKSQYPLYAKIGCQHRGTYTSTKLQLIVYTDKQCSKVYGGENNEANSDGYDLNGYFLSNKVRRKKRKSDDLEEIRFSIFHLLNDKHFIFYSTAKKYRSLSVLLSTAVKVAYPMKFPIPSQSDIRLGMMMITLAQRVRKEFTVVTMTITRKMMPREMAGTMQLNKAMMTMPTTTTIRMMTRTIMPQRLMMMPVIIIMMMPPPPTMPTLMIPMRTTTT
jgi:hypothetical protein